jgi:DNA-directed RNA polymerase subunit RPC12/RpoP
MSRGGEFPRKRGRNLRCAECGREQTAGELGWKAYLTTDEDEPAEASVYCPECAEGEFGVNLLDEGD